MDFEDYFERTDHEECIYSLFTKEKPGGFVGCVGFHLENNCEIEFYISKQYRNHGYCTEACEALIELVFSEGISVDEKNVTVDKLYATTLFDNAAAIRLLEKLGFRRNILADGAVLAMRVFVDEEEGDSFGICVDEFVLEKNNKDIS